MTQGRTASQLVALGWLSWRAHMVLWMELLMGAPRQASAVDLWVGAGVRERVFGCFLAGGGDRWLSLPPFHRLSQLL